MAVCIPAINNVCQQVSAVSVTQPTSQTIRGDTVETNPYYDSVNDVSYWTYKIVNFCSQSNVILPSDIYIPIYQNISTNMLLVEERILSCGRFEIVSFQFSNPTGVTPPAGFNYLNIPVSSRYTNGVSVVYRLRILGDYPQTNQTIYIESNQGLLTFDAGFPVPSEPPAPRLASAKDSVVSINGNQATIDYTVTVTNTGNVDVTEVLYNDNITYDNSNLTIGTITVDPPTINIDTSVPGVINLNGNIGDIAMGDAVTITYSVPITNFAAPNTYSFNSVTTATSPEAQVSVNSTATVEAVQFTVANTCNVTTSDTAEFTTAITSLSGSPMSDITIQTIITIPMGVTVQFTSFSICSAIFNDDLQPVPLNTDITNRVIQLNCDTTVPTSSTMNFVYKLRIVMSNDTSVIQSSITSVTLQAANSQVLIGVSPIPSSSSLNVTNTSTCSNQC